MIDEKMTTKDLFKYIIKKLPERIMKALPVTIAVAAVMWLLHTYLLVKVNEGFRPDSWLGKNLLFVSGRGISATVLWTLIGGAVTMFIKSITDGRNPFKSVIEMVKMPGSLIKLMKSGGTKILMLIFLSGAISLLCNNLFSGLTGLLAGTLLMSSLVAFITDDGSFFVDLLKMIVSDIQTFWFKKQRTGLKHDEIMLTIGSAGILLLFTGFLKMLPLTKALNNLVAYLWVLFALAGIIMLVIRSNAPKTMILLITFAGTGVFLMYASGAQVQADDGGWMEAGGTLGSWLKSQGAIPAMLMGLPPALGGLLGSLLTGILSGFSGIGSIIGGISPGTPPVDTTSSTGPQTTVNKDSISIKSGGNNEEDEQRKRDEENARILREIENKRKIELARDERRKAQEILNRIAAEREARQKYIDGLCRKYNTTPENLRTVIRKNMGDSENEAQSWLDYDKKLSYAEMAAKATVVACDTAIDGLANCTGTYGKAVRASYKVTKNIAQTMAEKGITKDALISGSIKGATDAATDFTDNPYAKAGLTIAGETAGGAATDGWKGAKDGFINGTYNAAVNAGLDKISGKGYGNNVTGGPNRSSMGTELSNIPVNLNAPAIRITNGANGTVTKNVSDLVAGKIIRQGQQSAIKGTGAMVNEFGVKPAIGL